jgi:hypothetical protein
MLAEIAKKQRMNLTDGAVGVDFYAGRRLLAAHATQP